MPTEFNPTRWFKIAFLGCILGLVLVLAVNTVWLLRFSLRHNAPLKLSEQSTRRQLIQVVDSQLAAFRKGDYADAYTHASAVLKEQMSVVALEHMVRNSYPAIANSRDAGFGMVFDNGDVGVVNVAVEDKSGRIVHYEYILRHEKAGWKIGGVERTRSSGILL
jgi:hypothetical protein